MNPADDGEHLRSMGNPDYRGSIQCQPTERKQPDGDQVLTRTSTKTTISQLTEEFNKFVACLNASSKMNQQGPNTDNTRESDSAPDPPPSVEETEQALAKLNQLLVQVKKWAPSVSLVAARQKLVGPAVSKTNGIRVISQPHQVTVVCGIIAHGREVIEVPGQVDSWLKVLSERNDYIGVEDTKLDLSIFEDPVYCRPDPLDSKLQATYPSPPGSTAVTTAIEKEKPDTAIPAHGPDARTNTVGLSVESPTPTQRNEDLSGRSVDTDSKGKTIPAKPAQQEYPRSVMDIDEGLTKRPIAMLGSDEDGDGSEEEYPG